MRSLDKDLAGKLASRGLADFARLPFLLEAKGQQQDEFHSRAQSAHANAQQKADESAFRLFEAELKNDQALHRKNVISALTQGEKRRTQLNIKHNTARRLFFGMQLICFTVFNTLFRRRSQLVKNLKALTNCGMIVVRY